MLSNAEMKAVMRSYVERLNAGDLEGVLALYADDATVEDPFGSTARRGKAEIREFYAVALASAAKLQIVGPQCGSAGNAATMPLVVEVTMPGAPKMRIDAIEIMRFNEAGKIIAMEAYWGAEDMVMSAE